MHRFFIPPQPAGKSTVILRGQEAHHLRSVLRLKAGALVELFDGRGTIYLARVTGEKDDTVLLTIEKTWQEGLSNPFPLTLAQAILKGKKMDLVCQKATELGVESMVPLHTRYCQAQKNMGQKFARWQRIVLESCKQCGRSTPMALHPPLSLEKLDSSSYRYLIFCWEKENRQQLLPETFKTPGKILLLIGPEGGFAEGEQRWAMEQGFLSVTLGANVLRAETAAISACAIVKYLSMLNTPPIQV